MIRLINAEKVYGSGDALTRAITNINLVFDQGEFVSITGKSGCGKTTLLNILGLIDKLTNGEYYYNNVRVNKLSDKSTANLRFSTFGYIFQTFNLLNTRTILENVVIPLGYMGIQKKERNSKSISILQELDIADKANRFPSELSGGQQQRVAVARALVNNPEVLLADEPTGNLDTENSKQIMRILQEINRKGTTVIMVTHDLELAQNADRVIQMNDGEILTNIH